MRIEWKNKVEELRELSKVKSSVAEIAKHYNASSKAVWRALLAYNIPAPKIVNVWESRKEEMQELAKKMTSTEMAQHFNVPARRMRCVLNRHQITALNPKGVERLLRMKTVLLEDAKTMSIKRMAQKHGCTQMSMSAALKALNIQAAHIKRTAPWMQDAETMHQLCATMTASQIAKHLGIKNSSVKATLKRNGFTPLERQKKVKEKKRRLPFVEIYGESIRQMVGTKTHVQIAKELGIGESTVSTICSKLGIQRKVVPVVRVKKEPGKPVKLVPLKQTKPWAPPQPTQYEVVMPKGVKVQRIQRRCSDWRSPMSAPVYKPGARTVSTRY